MSDLRNLVDSVGNKKGYVAKRTEYNYIYSFMYWGSVKVILVVMIVWIVWRLLSTLLRPIVAVLLPVMFIFSSDILVILVSSGFKYVN